MLLLLGYCSWCETILAHSSHTTYYDINYFTYAVTARTTKSNTAGQQLQYILVGLTEQIMFQLVLKGRRRISQHDVRQAVPDLGSGDQEGSTVDSLTDGTTSQR